ncbi:GNAT family N-acetyltransferase [Lapidilactobacillus bayanensis]|uniref:GNAT family N-acetyltransferase n=1 Tax=Lapidilactobacillus bayanensis TaxID=2485998 RepID=UPI0013DE3328|nr:GNAT family N-acetyltransferase [Lapidilactobacillus bayanensis]
MLENQRIYLRPFTDADLNFILQLGSDDLYRQTAGFAAVHNLDEAHKILRIYQQHPNDYVICLQETHQQIGFVELNERGIDERSQLADTREVGFILLKEFWNQGYMTEALKLVFDYAFIEMKISEIWAGHYENNQRSAHFLQKMGFDYKYDVQMPFPFIEQANEKYYLLTLSKWQRFRDKLR